MAAGIIGTDAALRVIPGGKMELAMQLIFTPFIWRMVERRKRAIGAL